MAGQSSDNDDNEDEVYADKEGDEWNINLT